MDYSWMPYFGGFGIFPLLCLLFMAVMMIACGGMLFRFCHGGRRGNRHDTAHQVGDRRGVEVKSVKTDDYRAID